jgi:YHS domain-containing protein
MRFDVEDAAAIEEYAGRTFYFCSVACREKFDDDRAFYARVADADSAPAS